MTTAKPSATLHFMAGGIGGTVGAALLCPLEVAKTRLQSSLYSKESFKSKNPLAIVSFHIKGVFRMLFKIQQEEGFKALWRGLGVNLVGVVPARAIYFSTYSQGKHLYTQLNSNKETSLVHMMSAATAGTATAMCTNPIWVAKTRVQLDSNLDKGSRKYRNSFNALKIIIKEEGVRGLYKGLSASILGLSESTIQFVLYEYFKKNVISRKQDQKKLGTFFLL
jgi:solute carrier family 25 protein 33/36